MKETQVKEGVHAWLEQEGYEFISREFFVDGGRIDFLAAKWPSEEYELDILGVECKGETNPAEVWSISSGQLAAYSRSVPKLYFACSKPPDAQLEGFASLCRVAGVGFLPIGVMQPHKVEYVGRISPRLDWDRYLRVRCRIALFLTFKRCVSQSVTNFRGRDYWWSTPEPTHEVQWNASIVSDQAWIGVNIENASQQLSKIRMGEIASILASLPSEGRCEIARLRYFGPGQRTRVPVRTCPVDQVVEELDQVRKLTSVSFWVGLPIWAWDEALSRQRHKERMAAAMSKLRPLYIELGRRLPLP